MVHATRVLFVGLHPSVVNFTKYPGLTADKLRAALDADRAKLGELGYTVDICFTDRGETAEQTLTELHGPDGQPAESVAQGELCAIRTPGVVRRGDQLYKFVPAETT